MNSNGESQPFPFQSAHFPGVGVANARAEKARAAVERIAVVCMLRVGWVIRSCG